MNTASLPLGYQGRTDGLAAYRSDLHNYAPADWSGRWEATIVDEKPLSPPAGKPAGLYVDGHEHETRVTDPATGGEKGAKTAQLGTLDPRALYTLAEVSGAGASKYEAFNFAKGYAWSLSYNAMQRHMLKWADGEDLDGESGQPHLAHAAWHCLALLSFTLRGRGTDDRISEFLRGLETSD